MIHKLSNGTTPSPDSLVDVISRNCSNEKTTFIIPLTFPDVSVAADRLTHIGYGGDVWELRVDLLSPENVLGRTNMPSTAYVKQQLDTLQRLSDLPILFTIRTASQGGKFPDDAHPEALKLMFLAIEAECSYIDVEIEWPTSMINEIVKNKANSRIIASFHDWTGNIRWTSQTLKDKYGEADRFGDIVKLGILSSDIYDCHELALFVRNHQQTKTKPILAVGMGRMGQLSRITSPISLVTHDKIPYPSAPGQLTLAEVHRARHLIGQLPKRKFFILGDNIAHSLSPTLHNAAFEELGLPHHYSIHQSLKIDDSVRQLITQPDFGGASVTYPHKREVTNLLDLISSSAKKIGAVNTIVVQENKARRVLVGDNTDWRGIKRCIELSNIHIEVETAIIIGAGGAARAAIYAVQELGISEVLLVNRTRGRVEKITLDFPSLKFQIFDNVRSLPSAAANIIVACVPADESREEDIPDSIFSDVGVLVEMAYRPHTTALMKVARRHGGWKVLGGVDVLKEQAYAQFSLWTGRRAPESVMADALNAAMVTH